MIIVRVIEVGGEDLETNTNYTLRVRAENDDTDRVSEWTKTQGYTLREYLLSVGITTSHGIEVYLHINS